MVAVRGLAVAAGHGALGQPQVPGPGLGVPGWQHLYTSTPALTLIAADNYGLELLKAEIKGWTLRVGLANRLPQKWES